MQTRFLALAALLSAVLAGARPAAAQLVPRLVDYPVVRVAACSPDPAGGVSRQVVTNGPQRSVRVYASPVCEPATLLFTIVRGTSGSNSIVPTQSGAAFLADRCGEYAWQPGIAQDVTDRCKVLGER